MDDPRSLASLPTIERRFRAMQQELDAQRVAFNLVAKNVVREGETLTIGEVAARITLMARQYVDVSDRLRKLEQAVRNLGACDLDAVGACHTHGFQGACPVGAAAELVRPVPSETTIIRAMADANIAPVKVH